MSKLVRIASREDFTSVMSIMDRAFYDDPSVRWYHSDSPETFALEHHLYVQLCAEAALPHGGVHVTSGYDGAAIWYPPDVGVSDEDYNTFKYTMRSPDKMDRLGDLAEACDEFRPNEPHWTLELLGVDPNAQNGGIGSNLMAFGLENANCAEMPVFLASSNRMNLPFYRRFGFDVVAEVNLDGLPAMFPMIRKPTPVSN